eukprot:m.1642807 g.1642807  ORF g.1642807 m.1642807 type:complete len:75 (-) comp55106_c0_seq1:98-322(-)
MKGQSTPNSTDGSSLPLLSQNTDVIFFVLLETQKVVLLNTMYIFLCTFKRILQTHTDNTHKKYACIQINDKDKT